MLYSRLRATSMNNFSSVYSGLFGSIEQSAFGEAVRTLPYLYPVLMSIHVLGIAMLVGPIIAVDLRILGIAKDSISISQTLRHLLPISRLGFVIVAITGVIMFTAIASIISNSSATPWKFGLIVLALVNVIVFHKGIYRKNKAWDIHHSPPMLAKISALISMVSWIGAIFGGRFLAY